MLIYILALMYLLLSVLIGVAARKRRMGFVLGMVLGLVLTPLVMFVVLALTDTTLAKAERGDASGQGRQA